MQEQTQPREAFLKKLDPILKALVIFAALLLLHNSFWLWYDARLVFGLPIGLLYHIIFCFVTAGVLALILKHLWPAEFDED